MPNYVRNILHIDGDVQAVKDFVGSNYSVFDFNKIISEPENCADWYSWLKNNFNLKERMARNFMEIFRRFSNRQSIADFDISTFKASTLVELLALPEGDEEIVAMYEECWGMPPFEEETQDDKIE